MSSFIIDFFDFFLPRFCPACNEKLSNQESGICLDCISLIAIADDSKISYDYNKKFGSGNILSGFTALYVFEKEKALQKILHEFKYNKKFRIGIKFGNEIALQRAEIMKNWNVDLIIPVPLHHLKKAERGFNQSSYIAKGLSDKSGIRYSECILKRTRYTESQTLRNIPERRLNVKDAFVVKKKLQVKGRNILLVDDVITTGATISECAKQLKVCGSGNIYAASIAIAG